MVKPKQMQRPEYGQKTADFLNVAYRDYLAARVLLNAELLPQAAVLASTAIEKYMKAVLAFRGNESHGHLKVAHWRAALNFDARLSSILNPDFLLLLQKSYKLRYVDDLEVGFNLVVASREFLAELDNAALMMQESFRLQKNGKAITTTYHEHKRARDERLVSSNYLFTDDQDKQKYIAAEPQLVYEVRNMGKGQLYSALYLARPGPSDGAFMRPGFKPIAQFPPQYKLAFLPLSPEQQRPEENWLNAGGGFVVPR